MNLRSIDLNLLVIFDALMAEKSITRAARKVGITPSAMSHALHRLRNTFNDELLQRTGRGMVSTQRAVDLGRPVHDALQEIQRVLDQQLSFDPETSERTFNIRVSDFLIGCLLPRMCARVRAEAPRVTMVFEHLPVNGKELYEPGDIQLRIETGVLRPEYRKERIWRDDFVIAMRRDHPAAQGEMTLDRYLRLAHLDVSSAIIDTRALDDVLDNKGLSRRIAITIPSLSGVVPILEHTDLCAVLPRHWITLYGKRGGLSTAALPLAGVEYGIDLVWHNRNDRDAGHRWLRQLIVQEIAVLYAPMPARRDRVADYRPHKLDIVPAKVAHRH